MLYDAQKAAAPILVTAGQHDQSFTFSEPILWADLPTIARPFVKWSAEVRRLEDLPRAIHRAAKTALAPPTGPVFLSLPADVLNAEADIELGAPTRVAPRLRGDRAAIETAAQLLAAARAAGDHRRRCRGAKRRPCRAGRARRAAGRAGLCRGRRQHRLLPVLASAVPRRHAALGAGPPRHPAAARSAVLGRRRSLHAVAALRGRADARRLGDHPSRYRSVGARQELRGAGRRSSATPRRHCRNSQRCCASV